MRLENRIAIVNGAGDDGSIGAAIAERFVKEGAQVVLCRRDGEKAKVLADALGPRAMPWACDVTRSAEVEAMVAGVVEKFGRLDILVNNVGFTTPGFVKDLSDEDWHRVLDGCLSSAFYGIRAALRPMRAQKSGTIINIGSAAGLGGAPGMAVYGAAKAGMIGLTQSAGIENFKSGVRINCVLPNAATKPMREWLETTEGGRITKARIEAYSRCGEPEEIASAVLFLASDDSSYVNAAILPVDGGLAGRVACIDADIE